MYNKPSSKSRLMSKGSILMVTSCYRRFGGIETVMDNLCMGLDKLGYDTCIGAYSFDNSPPENIKKVNLKRLGDLAKYNGNYFDIVHIHQGKMLYHSLQTSKPIVFHYHGANGKLQEINLQTAMFLCKRKIFKIISVSNTALEQLKKMLGNISSDIIYNGVNSEFYHPKLPQPYKKGDPQLLFVGNLYPTKNVPRLIVAMTQILQLYPKTHLQVVGDGKDYQVIKSLIKKKKLENNVEVLGRISDDELRLRYSSCDLYISASEFETFDLSAVEAMACGKPAILSDIPPHQEIINLSKSGLTFSLSDDSDIYKKIKEVYDKKDFFGSQTQYFTKKFSWAITCKQVANVYDEIMTRN